jgi:hypothetical protein
MTDPIVVWLDPYTLVALKNIGGMISAAINFLALSLLATGVMNWLDSWWWRRWETREDADRDRVSHG